MLDLFCGAGGASMGYHFAGFELTGVDNLSQPHYRHHFIQSDALEFLRDHGHEFDAIHASPPCQQYTVLRSIHKKSYPDLVHPTRELLITTNKPWIIENVVGSPLGFGFFLCGTMFPGLRVYRHRRFETSFWVWQPEHPRHKIPANGNQRQRKAQYMNGGFATIIGNIGSYCGDAMGINWMTGMELSQAIPPAYTEYIGQKLIDHLNRQ